MTRTASLVATTRWTETAPGIGPQTVVALPPSDEDPAVDEMRVYVSGILTTRRYDPDLDADALPPAGIFLDGGSAPVAHLVDLDGGTAAAVPTDVYDGGAA